MEVFKFKNMVHVSNVGLRFNGFLKDKVHTLREGLFTDTSMKWVSVYHLL